MSGEDPLNIVTSEDENEISVAYQKRKFDTDGEEQKSVDSQLKKRSRPSTASGINLVSYALDNDDGESESEDEELASNRSDSSRNNAVDYEDAVHSSGAIHFSVLGGGPLTVLSSAHIEAAHISPAVLPEEVLVDVAEQDEKDDLSLHSSTSNSSTHIQSIEVTLPPEPRELCSMQLQNVVETTLRRIQHDIGFDPNRVIQDNKAFRNPSIYKKLISFLDIDEKGTNFPQDVFNPYRWDANSFYDKLGEIQNREVERLEKLQKERRKAEVGASTGNNTTGLPRVASGPTTDTITNAQAPVHTAEKRPEIKKKSKWDTVVPAEPSQPPSKVTFPQAADPTAKITIPAIGDLFHRK